MRVICLEKNLLKPLFMNTSKKSFSINNEAVTANAISPATAIPSTSPQFAQSTVSQGQLLVLLPASDFYQIITMGVTNIELPVAEDTVINGFFIPKGAKVIANFKYTPSLLTGSMNVIDALMIKLLSVIIDNQTFPIETNTISLGDFSDPDESPLIRFGTLARLEVPIETIIPFEVEEFGVIA